MIRIVCTRRHGIECYRASISVAGHTHRESVHLSEQGARDWVTRTLRSMAAKPQANEVAA